MSDGLWAGSESSESVRQGRLTRHRLLVVSPGQVLSTSWGTQAQSGLASLDPNSIVPGTHNTAVDKGPEGGPHFVMSGDTPDESHAYGFEFALFTDGLNAPALPGTGGYTVTVWELVAATQDPGATSGSPPVWIAFQQQTGVNAREAWHSFDCNATMLRFQVTNLADNPVTNNKQIAIAFVEL